VWLLVRHQPAQRPVISAYSRGQLVRVGPYRYCNVVNLNDCQNDQAEGELRVDVRDPVQLSVPAAISRAPWLLRSFYDDPRDTTLDVSRPNTKLAATIPTVGSHGGRLNRVVVQLLTLVADEKGDLFPVPHAEWSVRTMWA
ncbi:MAG: DUF2771 domain-containing protein, partial [Mycobacteriaceae bacterium]|nr:DUF2771 domain-containing protein [Mycobacteriaceae bacterium]